MKQKNPLVAVIEKQVAAGQLTLAERTIMDVADTHGDNALVELVGQVAKPDLLAIVREYDVGKPTPIAAILTPEQIADLLELELGYGEGKDGHRLNALMHSFVLTGREDDAACVEAIFYHSGASIFATFFLTEGQATVETLREHIADLAKENGAIGSSETMMNDHGWQRLLWLLTRMEEHPMPSIIYWMEKIEAERIAREQKLEEEDEFPDANVPSKSRAVPLPGDQEENPEDDTSEESAL